MHSVSFLHFRPFHYQVMPWKNGGGTTTELIIEPEGSSLENGFLWRLSMAEVGSSGPFSRFPGYDRTLLLLEGHGMRLDVSGRESITLDELLQPVSFSGDLNTSNLLLNGACRDFNVITRRDRCHHHVQVLHLGAKPASIPRSDVQFAFCIRGRARVAPLQVEVLPMELLRVESPEQPLLWYAYEETVMVMVGMDCTDIPPIPGG